MMKLTNRELEEMSLDELRREWGEAFLRAATNNGLEEGAWTIRQGQLMKEMVNRCDIEAPRCPNCTSNKWGHKEDGMPYCIDCKNKINDDERLIVDIEKYFNCVFGIEIYDV
jgi:hypothetical protein